VVDRIVVNEESAEWRMDWEEVGNTVVILLFVVVVVAASPPPAPPASTPPPAPAPVLAELCPNLENPDLTDPASDPFDKLDRGDVALILPLCDWF
jgi:hypothetical protein